MGMGVNKRAATPLIKGGIRQIRRLWGWLWRQPLVREGGFFLLFLFHRYSPAQIDLSHLSTNCRLLLEGERSGWLTTSRQGALRPIKTRWGQWCFLGKNALCFGALQSRVERVVALTLIVLTLEWHNPFDRRLLALFLEKKRALVTQLLKKLRKINHKQWDQAAFEVHLDLFYRHSLLQHHVVQTMRRAVARAPIPEVVREAQRALDQGLYPVLITKGSSGSYWMRSRDREILGLFKPFDEELLAPNNPVGSSLQGALGQRKARQGCLVGEAAHHEVGAFVVDAFLGFGLVPRTYYASFTHYTFFSAYEDRLRFARRPKTKQGSFQEFIGGCVPFVYLSNEERLPLVEYQLLIVLDMIIGNTDRHANNILVHEGNIVAIDNGLSFPDQQRGFRFWYWELDLGAEPLIDSLRILLESFPFNDLAWKLRKRCCISLKSLARMRERIALFTAGVKAGLVPQQLVELFMPPYIDPLLDYDATLPEQAEASVRLFINTL